MEALVAGCTRARLAAPSEFLDEAEATGQILFIDNWVITRRAGSEGWQTEGPGAGILVVTQNVAQPASHHGIPGRSRSLRMTSSCDDLVIEMTEGSLITTQRSRTG